MNAVLGWFFRGFNRRLRPADRRLRLGGRQAAAAQRGRAAGLRRPAGADRTGSSSRRPPASSRSRTRAGSSSASSCPTRRRCSAPRRPWRRSTRSPARRRAWRTRSPSRACRSCCRPTAPTSPRCSSSSTRSTSGRAPSCATRPSWPGCAGSGRSRSRTRMVTVLRRLADPGPRRRRRLQAHGRGPRRPGAGRPCSSQTDDLVRKLQDHARPDRRRPRSSAPTRRSSSWTSTGPRPRRWACRSTTSIRRSSMYLGSLYVNSFNDFGRHWQVTVQAEGEYPQPGRGHQPVPGPEQAGPDGPAGHAGRRRARSAARSSVTRYNLYTAAADQRQHASRASAPATPSTTIDRAGRRDPAAVDEGGVDRADVHADPGGQHGDLRLRAGGRLRLPGAGGAVRELVAAAGGHPGGAAVPALLGGRRAVHEPRRQHLRADRPGRAGGPGVQERHPDRRVRQADAPGGPAASSRRRRRRRGCGCGRS